MYGGTFEQLPEILFSGKAVCPICANQLRGWNRSLYTASPTILYLCKIKDHELYKLGITKQPLVKLRYGKDFQFIENILYQITIFDGTIAWELEKTILKNLQNNKYTGGPIFKYTGNTEIFTINPYNIMIKEINERLL